MTLIIRHSHLSRASANRAAPFIHLMPVFGSVLAMVFLGERPQIFHAAGYALVLGGGALAARR